MGGEGGRGGKWKYHILQHGVVDLVIFGFQGRKNHEGLFRRSAYAATANYLEASSRSSQKINDGK